MTVITDLELPHFDYTDPELRGDRFHERMRELRAESWIARSDFGYFVLDRESANFFLRARSGEFPGVKMFELIGITEGPLYESLARNIITINGEQHARLRALVRTRSSRPRRPTATGLRCASSWPSCSSRSRKPAAASS